MESLEQVLNQASNAEVISNVGGTKVVSFSDYVAIAEKDLREGYDKGQRTLNADGTSAKTRTKYAAVNPELFFLNRYRIKNGKLYVCTSYPNDNDTYRALRNQNTGRINMAHVPVFIFARQKDGSLVLERKATVSADEFVGTFTDRISTKDMQTIIAPLIDRYTTNTATEATEFPI